MPTSYSFGMDNEPDLTSKHQAFPFQQEAVDFVAGRDHSAIFHEQGLGKTKIAIDVSLRWLIEQSVDTILIVTKKGLIANWQRELISHTYIRPAIISDESKSNYYAFTTTNRLVLAHFEALKKEEKRFKVWLESRRVAIIIDESAKIKNHEAALTQVYHRLAPLFTKRVIMTGTPAANRPYDIWAQIYFLDFGAALGNDFEVFKTDTDLDGVHHGGQQAIDAYGQRLRKVSERIKHLAIRETKAGGRILLPKKEYFQVDCNWEPTQRDMYYQIKDELKVTIQKDGDIVEEHQDEILKRLLRLVQVASHPGMIDDSYACEPGKFETLFELLSDIINKDEKAIVFTTFNFVSVWLTRRLASFGALMLNGKMAISDRNKSVQAFISNSTNKVLVATTGAAKEGLTLTVANHVIFFDRTYSLDDYLQAQDRIHRVSQTKTCYVYNLLMTDSIDTWIDALIEQKSLAAKVAQGDLSATEYGQVADMSFVGILQNILQAKSTTRG